MNIISSFRGSCCTDFSWQNPLIIADICVEWFSSSLARLFAEAVNERVCASYLNEWTSHCELDAGSFFVCIHLGAGLWRCVHACVWFAFSCGTLRCTCSPDGNAGNGYLLVVFPLAPHVVSLVAAASSVYEKFGHYTEELPVEQYQKFSHVVMYCG